MKEEKKKTGPVKEELPAQIPREWENVTKCMTSMSCGRGVVVKPIRMN